MRPGRLEEHRLRLRRRRMRLSLFRHPSGRSCIHSLSAILQRFPRAARRKALLATAGATLLIGLHSLVFPGLSGYIVQLGGTWSELPRNLIAYGSDLLHRFFGLGGGVFGWAFLSTLLALGCVGLIQRVRRGVSLAEIFTVSYALLILLWTNAVDLRFLIPLLPMWLMYAAVAVQSLPKQANVIIGGILLAATLGGYASRYSAVDFGPIGEGLGDPAFARICDYVRDSTPEGSVIVYDRPRLLALQSGRKVSPYHEPDSDRDLLSYFSGISAGYVLIDREYPDDRAYLEPLLLRNPSTHETHVEGSFHLYALR